MASVSTGSRYLQQSLKTDWQITNFKSTTIHVESKTGRVVCALLMGEASHQAVDAQRSEEEIWSLNVVAGLLGQQAVSTFALVDGAVAVVGAAVVLAVVPAVAVLVAAPLSQSWGWVPAADDELSEEKYCDVVEPPFLAQGQSWTAGLECLAQDQHLALTE